MNNNKESKHSKSKMKTNKDKEEFRQIKNKKNRTPEQIKKRRKIKILLLIIVLISILLFGIYTAISINNFNNLIKDMTTNKNSIVLDSEANTIADIGSEKIKEKVSLSDIPDNLKNAYISIEDERFYKHGGIDIKRTGGAIFSYVFHGGSSSYGGSTITQQLVKNLTGDSSSTITRKIKEWVKAESIESFMSKDEILELYLNIIYVGPNIYGIESGSQYYFNKSVKDLTLEECAFLAGINNSPNSYNPFDSKINNTEKINKRTKTVLSKMEKLKYINEKQYNEAIANVDSGLRFKNGKTNSNNSIYSYHTDALISQIINDISSSKKMSTTFATNYINMAGLTIYSTQNSSVQKQIETEFEKNKYKLASKNGGDSSQAAMVIIDHSTGQVIGCVGGLGKKTTSRGLNRATQSIRQTGSAIKPIAVLVPGISKKLFTGSTIFSDEKTEFADGYSPEDYSNYLGNITVRRALESSQNIPFVEMMQKINPKTSIKYLKKMGITSLTEKDNNLALALGGLDSGISPLQMAGAYSTIANNGVYIEPTFYTKVVKNGKLIVETKQKKKRVFSQEVAYIIKELLTEPVTGSNGTATYCSISGIDVAAKTGTTDENYDRWLCGFTPYYTGVTWYGYDKNETILYNGKKNPAGILWANIMSKIHSKLSDAKFQKPSGVNKITVCADTGEKANSGCSHTYEEYFLFGTAPSSCSKHSGTDLKGNTITNTKPTNTTTTNSFDMTTKEDIEDSKPSSENTNTNTTKNENKTYNNSTKTNTNTENTNKTITNNTTQEKTNKTESTNNHTKNDVTDTINTNLNNTQNKIN